MAATDMRTGKPKACSVGGELSFSRTVYSEIAARVLQDIRDVKEVGGDPATGTTGLGGRLRSIERLLTKRLLSRTDTHSGIQVDVGGGGEGGRRVAFRIDVVARHGADFGDLALDIRRRVSERVRHMTGRDAVVDVNCRGTSLQAGQ